MEGPFEGCTENELRNFHPTYLWEYLEYIHDIWHDYSTNIEVSYDGSEISVDPPESPQLVDLWATERQKWAKNLRENSYKMR